MVPAKPNTTSPTMTKRTARLSKALALTLVMTFTWSHASVNLEAARPRAYGTTDEQVDATHVIGEIGDDKTGRGENDACGPSNESKPSQSKILSPDEQPRHPPPVMNG